MTTTLTSLGGESSIKINFPHAARAISVRPEHVKNRDLSPGPQDYKVVNTEVYLPRNQVIPRHSFGKAAKDSTSTERITPGPSCYRPNSAIQMNQNPAYSIGSQKRKLTDVRDESPGPQDYNPLKPMREGPKFKMGMRFRSKISGKIPGPSDYNIIPSQWMIRNPRATIGNAGIKESDHDRQKSPGPGAYES
jgi:hypothetical protein